VSDEKVPGVRLKVVTEERPGPRETLRLVATLTVAGLLSGVILVAAYELTLPTIKANQAAALRRAVFEVVPGAERMQRLVWREGTLVLEEGEGGEEVYAAYGAGGGFLGFAIPAEGPGYQDTIKLIYGYDPGRRRVVGMTVLESRETPGLGDRIYKDQDFLSDFRDLAVEPEIEAVKDGADAPNEVDAITGATISSKSVVRIVNQSDARWLERLPTPEAVPPLPEEPDGS
jgi:electron transport complex protein RnfG